MRPIALSRLAANCCRKVGGVGIGYADLVVVVMMVVAMVMMMVVMMTVMIVVKVMVVALEEAVDVVGDGFVEVCVCAV